MSRLSGLAPDALPSPDRSTRGNGFKAWDTRRANALRRNVAILTRHTADTLPELQAAAHDVAESIAMRAWLRDARELPRGYSIELNSIREPALKRDGTLLNPGYQDPLPERASIDAFALDLKTGLLAEIEGFLKAGER